MRESYSEREERLDDVKREERPVGDDGLARMAREVLKLVGALEEQFEVWRVQPPHHLRLPDGLNCPHDLVPMKLQPELGDVVSRVGRPALKRLLELAIDLWDTCADAGGFRRAERELAALPGAAAEVAARGDTDGPTKWRKWASWLHEANTLALGASALGGLQASLSDLADIADGLGELLDDIDTWDEDAPLNGLVRVVEPPQLRPGEQRYLLTFEVRGVVAVTQVATSPKTARMQAEIALAEMGLPDGLEVTLELCEVLS